MGDLDKWAPEELGRASSILIDEELSAGLDELILGQKTIIVGVNSLEGGWGHVGVQADDVEEDAVFVGADEAVVVGVNSSEEEWERSLEGFLKAGITDLLLHGLNEGSLVDAITSDLAQEVVPHSADLGLDDLASGGISLFLLNEAGAHALEVFPGDCAILIEVNPGEVGLHLADPEVRHDCWLVGVTTHKLKT